MPRGVRVHQLVEKDINTRTGSCIVCGPTRIKSMGPDARGQQRWRCLGGARKHRRTGRPRNKNSKLKREIGICERCDFVPEDLVQLDVHHKDRDHENDLRENLEVICSNCHRLEHAGEVFDGQDQIS